MCYVTIIAFSANIVTSYLISTPIMASHPDVSCEHSSDSSGELKRKRNRDECSGFSSLPLQQGFMASFPRIHLLGVTFLCHFDPNCH